MFVGRNNWPPSVWLLALLMTALSAAALALGVGWGVIAVLVCVILILGARGASEHYRSLWRDDPDL